MTAQIIRCWSEPAGSIIEAAYNPSRFCCLKAANEDAHAAAPGLTRAEAEILTHLATGKGAAAVAGLLQIDGVAVKAHIQSVLRKLRAREAAAPSV